MTSSGNISLNETVSPTPGAVPESVSFSMELAVKTLAARRISATFAGEILRATADHRKVMQLHCERRSDTSWTAAVFEINPQDNAELTAAMLAVLHAAFVASPELKLLTVDFGHHQTHAQNLMQAGVGVLPAGGPDAGAMRLDFFRSMFWQHHMPWLKGPASADYPLRYTISAGRRHPLRPPRTPGAVYSRFIPWLGGQLSLRTVNAEIDLPLFHRWMNNPRVDHFWQEAGTYDRHRAYLAEVLAKSHTHPLIGCFDGRPFGYFEAYWAREDRIAPFYGVDDYDRGVHMLVGEESFRGPARVAAWLPSLMHYLFLDDPRTRTIVCEPRRDNERMIAYLQRYGFARFKNFDFPHKRAALMMLHRETFFEEDFL